MMESEQSKTKAEQKSLNFFQKIQAKVLVWWEYCSSGVWRDTRKDWKVSIVKTLNIVIRSFLDRDIQSTACALTYRTLLAIVPALAILFAIGRGFGFQSVLKDQLLHSFPAQAYALNTAFNFVDSCLSQASEGIFLGVGFVFLLWTLISLLSSVADSFNRIWNIIHGRSIWRKATDYLAVMIVLPILMICGSGITIVMSTTLKAIFPDLLHGTFESFLMDSISIILSWLFFTGTYLLIPNTKVKFPNALVAGIIVGTAYGVIQWLFLSGQLYVAKYNAIYGSFSFLPLLLLWIQLTWLITLVGCLLCYASQNIGYFNFGIDISNISLSYRRKVTIAIMAIIAHRFIDNLPPLDARQIASDYGLPQRLVIETIARLSKVGLICHIEKNGCRESELPVQPAVDTSTLTIAGIIERLQHTGCNDFIPDFSSRFPEAIKISDSITESMSKDLHNTGILDIKIPKYNPQ